MPTYIDGKFRHSICWDCKRSRLIFGIGCSWAFDFKPVPGWTAIRNDVKHSTQGLTSTSYCVLDCPKFIPENNDGNLEAEYAKQGT